MKKLFIVVFCCLITAFCACNKTQENKEENITNNNFEEDEKNVENQKTLNDQLLKAAVVGNSEQVKKLIARGADVNYKDEEGRTVLMYAVLAPFAHYDIEETKQIIKMLITAQADINDSDKEGNTALMAVVSEFSYSDGADDDRVSLIDILVSAGANVNAVNKKGKNALMSIGLDGWIDYSKIATKLLSMGADINAKDHQGRTVLMDFVNKIDEKESSLPDNDDYPRECPSIDQIKSFLKTLISNGADINAKENTGKTALKIAKEKGNIEIVKLLKSYGAKE